MVHFVHLSVSGVHVDYVRVRHLVDYDEVLQLLFHYDMGNGGLGHHLQCIELGAYAFGRQPSLVAASIIPSTLVPFWSVKAY